MNRFALLTLLLMLTFSANAATLFNNLPANQATYLGGSGGDTITAVDSSDTAFYVAGKAPDFTPAGIVPAAPLGSGEGLVMVYNSDGAPIAAARFPGEVVDLEANKSGNVVVCGSFGIAVLDSMLMTVSYSQTADVKRCTIGDDGTSAGINGNTITVYSLDGTPQGTWDSGNLYDLAIHSASQTVIETGYRQAASDLQVAFLIGRSYTGIEKWKNYDFSASAVKGANLGADSRGERVAIGNDDQLYFAGYVDGGNAIYGRSPRNISQPLSGTQLIKTDAYNDPFNISGAKALGWYGRFNPATGELDRGQFLLTRLSDGKSNSIGIRAITADTNGMVYLGGEAYASIENRNNLKVGGISVGAYSGGEPFALVVSPDLTNRLFWTSFAATGASAGSSPVHGVAVLDNRAALGATLKLDSGQRAITLNAPQPNIGGGTSDGYIVFWQNDLQLPDKPLLVSPASGSIINAHSPIFQWTGQNADRVKLIVKNSSGVKLFSQIYNASDVCPVDGACEVNQAISLRNGTGFLWKVKAFNALGMVTAKARFSVNFPGAPTLVNPANNIDVSTNLTLEWAEVTAANEYKVVIIRSADGARVDSGWFPASCISGICQYNATLTGGVHKWFVVVRQSPVKNKSKSEKRTFNVIP